MKIKHRSLIFFIIPIGILVFIGSAAYVYGKPKAVSPNLTGDLVLHNLGINLGIYDPATKKAGDILFTKNIGQHYYRKALLEFGASLTGPSGTDIMPHLTFFVPQGTKIVSPVNGKIENIRYQAESNDHEAVILPDGYADWRLSFDHIKDLKVKIGDRISVGQLLAEVGPPNSAAVPPGFGWTELQVWKSSWRNPAGDAKCPFLLLDENIKKDLSEKMTRLADDWNKYLGEKVYDKEKWVFPGCLYEKAKS